MAVGPSLTRKVAAGLVIGPRFGWSAVGSLLGDVAFRVEPQIGGLPMVPGSAREVPPWILAGPVLARIAALIDRLSRAFTTRTEDRSVPRGSVDWSHYARVAVPRGAWTTFRCTYSDLELDPWLVAASRWTVERMRDELAKVQSSAPALTSPPKRTSVVAMSVMGCGSQGSKVSPRYSVVYLAKAADLSANISSQVVFWSDKLRLRCFSVATTLIGREAADKSLGSVS